MKKLLSMMLALTMLISTSSAFALPLSAEGVQETASEAVTTAPEESPALPEVTTAPEVTTVPEETAAPEETTIPETTPVPEETSEPSSEVTEPATEAVDPATEGTDSTPEVIEPLPEDELLSAALPLAEGDGIVASGYCGDEEDGALDGTNLTWTLDSEGTLTISGTGYMYGEGDGGPWYPYRDTIRTVIIEDGVASIGPFAFSSYEFANEEDKQYEFWYPNLTSVTIAGSIERMSTSAFGHCPNLSSVILQNGVKGIGKGAFSGCAGLTSITLPDSINVIGMSAFSECTNLKTLTIPGNVEYLDDYVVGDCSSLTDIYCEAKSKPEGWEDFWNEGCKARVHWGYKEASVGIIDSGYCGGEGDGTNLSWVLDCEEVLTISGSGSMANWNSNSKAPWYKHRSSIAHVRIGEGVTNISDYAFYWNAGLTSIEIPSSVISIGEKAFYSCRKLESIMISSGVRGIGALAFSGCESLTEIMVDPANPVYSSVDGALFSKDMSRLICYSVGNQRSSYVIPNSVRIIDVDAFNTCSSLTSIVIPDSVTTIGKSAFSGCTGLVTVTIPSSVVSISDGAFYECTSLTGVTISNGVTSIGISAFEWCDNLASVTIPNSVTYIGERAFCYCSQTDIYCEAESKPDGWHEDWNSSNAEVHWGVASVLATGKCGGEGDGSNLTWKLDSNGTLTITGTGKMCDYWSQQNYMLSNAPWESFKNSIRNVIIDEGVTSIGNGALYNYYNLTNVTIPNSVTSIGNYAFAYCSPGLTSLTIPDSVTSIGDAAFIGCQSLTGITIPDSVTSIGDNAFYDCENLTGITIPDSVTSIGFAAFSAGCQGVEVAPGNRYYHMGGNCLIETGTRKLISGFNNSVIPADGSVTSIGISAFFGCDEITSIVIPNGVISIGDSAFTGCKNLTSITIPDSVTSIGQGAFSECRNLSDITIPNSVTSIGARAFSGCQSVEVAAGNRNYHMDGNCLIETGTRKLIAGFNNSVIPDDGSIISIGDGAFSSCQSLASISIPDSVTSIGRSAFAGCQSLASISIPDSVTSIADGTFMSCQSLKSITIPNSIKSIGSVAFFNSGLTSITIPKSVISIGEQAFSYCPNLTTIYCEVKSKPSGWADNWNDQTSWGGESEKVNVIWGDAEVADYIPGDFNEDGEVDMRDAAHFIGWVGAPFLPQFQINQDFNADFNKDGTIDMKDAAYYIGWVGAPFLPQFKIDW